MTAAPDSSSLVLPTEISEAIKELIAAFDMGRSKDFPRLYNAIGRSLHS